MADTCCVCHQNFEGGKTFELTEEERELIGPQAPQEVYYCPPCLRVMSDRDSGAQLIKGLYEMRLKELGVPNSREASLKLLKFLTGK